jgi:hypothetical protein
MPSSEDLNVITALKQMLTGAKPNEAPLEQNILPATGRMTIEQAQKHGDLCLQLKGVNKRPIGLLPLPDSERDEDHEIVWSHNLDAVQLLSSLEIQQFSGVVRIFSEKRQFRTAMLFFKGRVIGCIYSRVFLTKPLLDEQACSAFLYRLTEPGNIVHAYRLEPDLVLSASALFHSVAETRKKDMATADLVLQAMAPILGNLRTGCIALNNAEGTVCAIYVRLGVIIGVYSYSQGWLEPDVESIVSCLDGAGLVEMFDSTVSILHEDDFEHLTIRSARVVWRRWIVQGRRKARVNLREIESNAPPSSGKTTRSKLGVGEPPSLRPCARATERKNLRGLEAILKQKKEPLQYQL